MRSRRTSHPVLGALLAAIAVVLLGCSVGSDSSIEPEPESPAQEGAVIDPDLQWVESLSTRPSGPNFTRTISPDGKWLATAGGLDGVCIFSLTDDAQAPCVNDPTIGTDTLSWDADSSMVVTGGSTSGRFNATGVWTVATDGSLSSVSRVDEGNLARGDDGVLNLGMAFRPDGESIVFTQWAPERVEIVEIGLDGSDRRVLLDLEAPRDVGFGAHLPLDGERMVVNTGVVGEPGVDLVEDGAATRLITAVEEGPGVTVAPFAIAATATSDEFADGVALVVAWRASARGFEKNDWWLVDFAGNEHPLVTAENENVVAATLSPDGNYVAYVTRDPLTDVDRIEVAVHVIELSAVVDGSGPLGTHIVEADDPAVIYGLVGFEDFRFMRWTTDNRLLIALRSNDEAPVLEIDLNASAR